MQYSMSQINMTDGCGESRDWSSIRCEYVKQQLVHDANNPGSESTGLHQRKKICVCASRTRVPQPKAADRMVAMAGFLLYERVFEVEAGSAAAANESQSLGSTRTRLNGAANSAEYARRLGKLMGLGHSCCTCNLQTQK